MEPDEFIDAVFAVLAFGDRMLTYHRASEEHGRESLEAKKASEELDEAMSVVRDDFAGFYRELVRDLSHRISMRTD
jgi:hypothetical protein